MRIIRLLFRHKGAVALVFVLLIGQAFCELSIPRMTSDIVDVGIQQTGIEHVAVEELSERSYNVASMLLSGDDADKFKKSYDKTDSGTYKLNEYGESIIEELDLIMAAPLIAAHNATGSQDLAVTGDDGNIESISNLDELLEGYQSGNVSGNDLAVIAGQLVESIGSNESLLSQQGLAAAQAEYEDLGYDLSEMQMDYLVRTGLLMLLFAAGSMMIAILVALVAAHTGARTSYELRDSLFTRVMTFNEGEIGHFSAASLITRGTNDIQVIQNTIIMFLRSVLYAPILAVGGIIMITFTNAAMGWIIVIAVVAVFALIIILFRVAMPRFRIMQKLIDRVNLVARELLTGLSVVRAFGREKYEEDRFDVASTRLMRTQIFTNRVMAFMMPIMTLVMNATSVAIIWFGGFYVESGVIQTGDLIAFITYAMVIVMGFLMIGMVAIMLPRANVAAGRVEEVITCEPSVRDPQEADRKTIPADSAMHGAEITFNNVSFHYGEDSENVIENVSFTAAPGETLAIVGATGSGKSTIMKLIERFYDVCEGSVTIDGIDVRDLTQADLRTQIGYVPQKSFLLSGTVATNVAYGNENATVERINEALEIAQAADFVEERGGIDSPISQGGSNVSGGQRQRLAIARAIATDARAFLFDDSFSALDYATDAALRESIAQHYENTTCIIVAQRISTVMGADNIIVLDDGRLVGQGTHDELMKTCEEYREIALSQLSESELELGGDDA